MHAHLRFPFAIIVVEARTSYHILRGDPRFAAMIEEMKARFAAG